MFRGVFILDVEAKMSWQALVVIIPAGLLTGVSLMMLVSGGWQGLVAYAVSATAGLLLALLLLMMAVGG